MPYDNRKEAIEALTALGYSKSDAVKVISAISIDENMDVEQLLADMDSMEEGGTRFVNIQKKDKKLLKRNALFAATIFILFMLMIIGIMLWASSQESILLIILILFIGIPSVCIGGTLLALKERLKEIEGGELDEASKY